MIYHLVHNEQDAWDLAQDGFFKAWKSIDKFRFQSSFYTWLYRIMTNVSIDSLRKKQITSGQEFDDTISLQDLEPGSDLAPKSEPLPIQTMERGEVRAQGSTPPSPSCPRSIAPLSCSRKWKTSSTTKSPKRWVAPLAR